MILLPVLWLLAQTAPPTLQLEALTAHEVAAAKTRSDGRAVAGTHREVPGLMKKGKWQHGIWRVRIRSVGAHALRLHFQSFESGKGAVSVSGGANAPSPVTGDGPDFWSDLIFGDSAILEYTPPDRRKSKRLPFVVDRISHQFPPGS